MAFATLSWTRLVAVHLSLREKLFVRVTMLTFCHFLPHLFPRNRVIHRQGSSFTAFFVVRQIVDVLTGLFVFFLVAPHIRPCELMSIHEFLPNCIRSSNVQVSDKLIIPSIVVGSVINLVNYMLDHHEAVRMILSHSLK